MHIGKLCFGKRAYGTKRFRWFYSPMLKETMKRENFVFFWWIGWHWYLCLRR